MRNESLRHVQLEATFGRVFTLQTWDTGQTDHYHKSILAYIFRGPQGVLFKGADFHCAPSFAIDSDDCLRSLLGFLTLRPGDTDAEYFAAYTPEQLAYCNQDAEWLSLYADEEDTEPFQEVTT